MRCAKMMNWIVIAFWTLLTAGTTLSATRLPDQTSTRLSFSENDPETDVVLLPTTESISPKKRNVTRTFATTNCTEAIEASCLYKPWYPAVAAWIGLFAAGAFPGNLLVLIAFVKKSSLRTPTNILIFNQSIADLLTVFTVIFFIFSNYTEVGLEYTLKSKYGCLFGLSALLMSISASLYNILILSLERFYAVFLPYSYVAHATPQKAWAASVIVWSFVVGINSMPLLGWNAWVPGQPCFTTHVYNPVYMINVYLLPKVITLLVCLLLHVSISVAAWRGRKIAPEHFVAQDSNAVLIPHDFKITRMFLMVVGVFYVSWLPWIICTGLTIATDVPSTALVITHDFSKGVVGMNTVLNPLIYAYKNKRFREAFKKILHIHPSEENFHASTTVDS